MQTECIIGAVNWEVRVIQTLEEFFAHCDEFFEHARTEKVDILVLPEYFTFELLSLAPKDLAPAQYPVFLAEYFDEICGFVKRRSREHGMSIIAGSSPRKHSNALFNTNYSISSAGDSILHDKQQLIPFERDVWNFSSGNDDDSQLNSAAAIVAICYEVEFPALIFRRTQQNTKIICVPSQTDTVRGFNRVRFCCQARTVEQQLYVAHSSLIGELPGLQFTGYGSSAILAPPDAATSDSGILAETDVNQEGIAISLLDLEAIDDIRQHGEVTPFLDQRQSESPIPRT